MLRAQLYPAAYGPPVLLKAASATLLYHAQINRTGPAKTRFVRVSAAWWTRTSPIVAVCQATDTPQCRYRPDS
jgi:hypothetical protein